MKEIFSNLQSIKKIFQESGVVLAYIFGSVAKKGFNKLSDIDFAVFLNKAISQSKYYTIRLLLLDQLGRVIKNKPLDVAILNNASPLLSQLVILQGKVIFYEDEDLRVSFQLKSLKEFDDALYLRKVYYNYLEERVKENKLGDMSVHAR
ncbi:MAG: nucleotidyltransferase domain-containing protein [Actinobacteria bacterium]|nr:nucleotidyltransferase domain-containing protein [Actinomycetota bacterium]